MKKSLAVILALLLLLGLQCLSQADTQQDPIKWSQLPDMGRGYQFSSEIKVPSVVGDDWVCPDGRPVTDIHWWGGYWSPVNAGSYGNYLDSRPSMLSPGTLQSFDIKIWSNVPAGGSEPYSRPGTLLESYNFGIGAANEVFQGTTTFGKNLYQYYVDLPQDRPFAQVQGTTYWLTIQAVMTDNTAQWGWHESNDHHGGAAVQNFKDGGWLVIQNNQYDNDMAFELTTIPEPAGLCVMGTGLVGMASFLFRRRK